MSIHWRNLGKLEAYFVDRPPVKILEFETVRLDYLSGDFQNHDWRYL